MKKILVGTLIIFLSIGAVNAQNRDEKKQRHQKHQKEMTLQKLNLSADQQSRIKTINENYRKQVAELKKQDQLTVKEMKARKSSLHEQHKADIQAALTTEQKARLAEMKKSGKDKMVNGRQQKGNKMQEELNLNADQKAKLAQMRSDMKVKADAIKNDKKLTAEQKKERFKELNKQQHEQMKSVLTKEQMEKAKSLRKERPVRNSK